MANAISALPNAPDTREVPLAAAPLPCADDGGWLPIEQHDETSGIAQERTRHSGDSAKSVATFIRDPHALS